MDEDYPAKRVRFGLPVLASLPKDLKMEEAAGPSNPVAQTSQGSSGFPHSMSPAAGVINFTPFANASSRTIGGPGIPFTSSSFVGPTSYTGPRSSENPNSFASSSVHSIPFTDLRATTHLNGPITRSLAGPSSSSAGHSWKVSSVSSVVPGSGFSSSHGKEGVGAQSTPPLGAAKPRYWTREEHLKFLEALGQTPRLNLQGVAARVGTRSTIQTRTHYQKYVQRIERIAVQIATRICSQENLNPPSSFDDMNPELVRLALLVAVSTDYRVYQIEMADQSKKRKRRM